MVQDRFVDLRGLSFHYRDWGGNGTPLILLHGLASTSHIFDLVAPQLAAPRGARGFRVLALDSRGHGESAKPDEGYDFENIVADLLAFMDAPSVRLGGARRRREGAPAIVAGHSWGGNVALQFAAQHPARAAALVLIDGGFLDIQANPEMTWERTARQLAPPNLLGTPVQDFQRGIKGFLGRLWKPEVEEAVLANFQVLPDGTISPRLSFERHMKILRALWEQRPQRLYPTIQCPALLLPAVRPAHEAREAEFNQVKRTNVRRAAHSLARSETIWFRDTVHDIPLHRPRKLANAIIRFAARQGVTGRGGYSAP